MSRVVPAISVTIARFVPVHAFSRLDLPTLGRPTMATCNQQANDHAVTPRLSTVQQRCACCTNLNYTEAHYMQQIYCKRELLRQVWQCAPVYQLPGHMPMALPTKGNDSCSPAGYGCSAPNPVLLLVLRVCILRGPLGTSRLLRLCWLRLQLRQRLLMYCEW